jgi:hypothetical protein
MVPVKEPVLEDEPPHPDKKSMISRETKMRVVIVPILNEG